MVTKLGTFTVALLLAFVAPAHATFHLWRISEIYSNADASVQFIEFTALAAGQQFLSGHRVTSTQGNQTRSFSFPSDLPGDSAEGEGGGPYGGTGTAVFKSFLIGTQGFAALGLVAPDYVVPNGFLFTSNGTLNFADSDIFSYPILPTDGSLSLYRNGNAAASTPKNFVGFSNTVTFQDYSGAWFNASESGWGLSVIRGASGAYGVVLYHYNASRNATWYFMSGGSFSGNTYTAPITLSSGPAFGEPFNAAPVSSMAVGTATIVFTSTTTASLTFTIAGISVSRNISKIVF